MDYSLKCISNASDMSADRLPKVNHDHVQFVHALFTTPPNYALWLEYIIQLYNLDTFPSRGNKSPMCTYHYSVVMNSLKKSHIRVYYNSIYNIISVLLVNDTCIHSMYIYTRIAENPLLMASPLFSS